MKRLLIFLLSCKLVSAVLGAFTPPDSPHVWRQIDTLGVAMRYGLRLIHEGFSTQWFLPAVLNSGDAYGFMPMEFPLLNILAAPAFLLGPELGNAVAQLLVILLNVGLWLWCIRLYKGTRFKDVDLGAALWCLPVVGYPLIYMNKFIPDPFAVLLVLSGMGLLLRSKAWGGLFVAAGLLVKPTAVVTLAFWFLARPMNKAQLAALARLVALPIALAILYYTAGIDALKQLQDGTTLFAVDARSMTANIASIPGRLPEIFALMLGDMVVPGFLVPGVYLLWKVPTRRMDYSLIGALIVGQVLAIYLLDGAHSLIHEYYYMGTAPVAAALVMFLVQDMRQQARKTLTGKWLLGFMVIFIVGHNLNRISFDLRSLYSPAPLSRVLPFELCERLRQKTPDLPWGRDYVWRTDPYHYPMVGYCFGVRMGSHSSAYGILLPGAVIPEGCQPLAADQGLYIIRCLSEEVVQ